MQERSEITKRLSTFKLETGLIQTLVYVLKEEELDQKETINVNMGAGSDEYN